jgi:hypothetical protein
MTRGQALVEFALIFPILAATFLGMGEAGFLFSAQHGYQNEADILASWVAIRGHEDAAWHQLVVDERDRTGCDGEPDVSWFDDDMGDHHPGSRVLVSLTCHYSPRITGNVWPDGLDVSVQSEAVIPGSPAPEPTPTPSPDPSPSPS